MDILLDHISKTYQGHQARQLIFQQMTACFASGLFFVIMGKSGVGKSSLLNLISGIDVPDSGRIQIGTHLLSEMDDRHRTIFRRKHIGFIYQFFNLIPVLTVLENITLICELDGLPRKAYAARPGPTCCGP